MSRRSSSLPPRDSSGTFIRAAALAQPTTADQSIESPDVPGALPRTANTTAEASSLWSLVDIQREARSLHLPPDVDDTRLSSPKSTRLSTHPWKNSCTLPAPLRWHHLVHACSPSTPTSIYADTAGEFQLALPRRLS